MPRPMLVLDTASPTVSLAVGVDGAVVAQRTLPLRRSAEGLLTAVDEALFEAGVAFGDLGGVGVLRGPGSFTGLRVGLATVLGWHQALSLPATAWPTLPILAEAALEARPDATEIVAVVDALRGEWSAQTFHRGENHGPEPLGEAELRPATDLCAQTSLVVGFGIESLANSGPAQSAAAQSGPAQSESGDARPELLEAPPLAPAALRWAARQTIDWDASKLTSPIYFRAPAATPAARYGTRASSLAGTSPVKSQAD